MSTTWGLVLAAIRVVWWDTSEIGLRSSDKKEIRKDQMKVSEADRYSIFFLQYKVSQISQTHSALDWFLI